MKHFYLILSLWGILPLLARAASPAPPQHLEFIENRGQWPAPVRFAADVPGGRLFLEPTGLTYALSAGLPHPHAEPGTAASPAPTPSGPVKAHALKVEFVGATAASPTQALEPTQEVRNYLRGNDPSRWAHNVPSFRVVRYPSLWPGIAARLYENQQEQLEYDFEVAPGSQPTAIRLRYRGADALRLTLEGHLEIRTSVGTLRELAPRAWQTTPTGERRPVSCAYVLEGEQVRFRLGTYDPALPLTIDPTVVFSTFTGSRADNWGFTATYDQQGNMYSGGIVFSVGYPASPGAYSEQFQGGVDIAIIKYNTAATGPAARVWATYLGGSRAEFPQSLVVNSRGELLILATTGSADFPTSATAFNRTFRGGPSVNPFSFSLSATNLPFGSDLAVARLSADGSRLLGATFLGGQSNEGLILSGTALLQNYGDQFRGDILVDDQDNVYLASNTASADFPGRNSFQAAAAGLDGVVCKLNPNLSQLIWGSHLGGSQADAAYSLQLDAAGRLYVAGGTASPNFPTTAGTYTPAQRGWNDGFVVRISASGTTLEKAALLATAGFDQAYFVQLDQRGGVYLLGQTTGSYPVEGNRYSVLNGRQFIHKLDADLSTTEFALVFGTGRYNADLSPTAFLVDQCERIYVAGWGGGNNQTYGNGTVFGLPTTPNATQRTTDGSDFYLMQLSTGAYNLDYATFFGGTGQDHVDGGTSRFDPRGVVYQAVCGGCGGSSSWPIPPGAGSYSTTNGSPNCNNAAFKYNFETVNVVAGTDRDVCATAPPQWLYGSPGGGVWSGPGVQGSLATGFTFSPSLALLGPQTLTYTVTGVGPCGGVSTLRLNVVPPPPPAAFTAPAQRSFCLNNATETVPLAATPAGGTFTGPGVMNGAFVPSLAGPGTHTLTYTVEVNSCSLQTSLTVTVTRAEAGPSFTICSGAAPVPLAGTPAGGVWAGPGVIGSAAMGFTFTPTNLQGYQQLTYTVTAPGGCTSRSELTVTIVPTPPLSLPTLPAFCSTSSAPTSLPGNGVWSGPGVQGYTWTGYTFTPTLAGAGTHTLTYRTGFALCDAVGTVTATVSPPPVVVVGPDTALCPGSTRPFRLRAAPAGGTWSGPGVTPEGVFTPPAGFAGSATLVYTLPGVCPTTTTRRVSVAQPPALTLGWNPATCPDNRLAPLTVTFSGGTSASTWDFGDGTPSVTGSTVSHTYAQAGTYQPSVSTAFNTGRCRVTTSLAALNVIPPMLPPNIITPNGDPKNEFFVVRTGCPAQLQVFSRWGAKVFEAARYENNWNADGLPDGVYYYLLRPADGPAVKGWLTVQRQ